MMSTIETEKKTVQYVSEFYLSCLEIELSPTLSVWAADPSAALGAKLPACSACGAWGLGREADTAKSCCFEAVYL